MLGLKQRSKLELSVCVCVCACVCVCVCVRSRNAPIQHESCQQGRINHESDNVYFAHAGQQSRCEPRNRQLKIVETKNGICALFFISSRRILPDKSDKRIALHLANMWQFAQKEICLFSAANRETQRGARPTSILGFATLRT